MGNKPHLWILLCTATTFVVVFFGDIISDPNGVMLSSTGDGMKNYFTYAYQIEHGKSLLEFEGMNYPYGEFFMYTDCHPVLTSLFQTLSGSIPTVSYYSVGILNVLLILSIFISFFICYLLLRELKIERWHSLLFSVISVLLAPQIFRLTGHFALSYSIAIPLTWLLYLKAKRANALFLVVFLLNNLFWLFVHAYLGLIAIALVSLIAILETVRSGFSKRHLQLLAVSVAPLLLFYMFTQSMDSHLNRTDNPSGFFSYNAELDDILVPHHGPVRIALDSVMGGVIKQEWEAWSYIGFPTVILLIFLLFKWLLHRVKKKPSAFIENVFKDQDLNHALLSSLTLLLFAMNIPFKQFPALLDLLPLLKQFRATGRFTWPFYFVAMVYSARSFSYLFYYLKAERSKNVARFSALLIAIIYLTEGISHQCYIKDEMSLSPNLFHSGSIDDSHFQVIQSIRPEDYQAILPLPFYHYGSEAYSRPRQDAIKSSSMIISYNMGLPLFAADLTRSSIDESRRIIQMLGPDHYQKEILPDLESARPILIIHDGSYLTNNERNILNKGELVFTSDGLQAYKLELRSLWQSSAPLIFEQYSQIDNGTMDWVFSEPNSFFFFEDFETRSSTITHRGSGAFQGLKKERNLFTSFPAGTFKPNTEYELSMWMHNGVKDALNLYLRVIVEEYDANRDEWYSTTAFPDQAETINGDWSQLKFSFQVKDPSNEISIISIGKKDAKPSLYLDDLMIIERGVDVFRSINDEKLFFNNHIVDISRFQQNLDSIN